MKREEYMGALQSALIGFDEELAQEIVSDYEERFRVGAERGKTVEQIIAELGSIKDLVDELLEMQQSAEEGFKTAGLGQTTESNTSTWKQTADNSTGSGTQNNKENNFKSRGQSGTYYQEKSFADSFDSAMKKFGKVFDKVMRETGRVIEDAAEKIEYHFEEAKRNYTNNGKFGFGYSADNGDFDFTYESSERDGSVEPNVEQSGEGTEECHKVIVNADFADVTFYSAQEAKPKAVCHYYSHKTAMMYPFYAKQDGDTFYVGIYRNQETERKSGFFQINTSPSVEIDLFLPTGVVLAEAGSSGGDFKLNEVSPAELVLHTKSGDISAKRLACDRIHMETASGDINLLNSNVKNAALITKSGDCHVDFLESEEDMASLAVRTVSGDVDVKNMRIGIMEVSTTSGDIGIEKCYGEALEAGTTSGDISIKAGYKKYNVKSHSGEVELESCRDADIIAHSTSGDVEVYMIGAIETYQVSMHSVSGECTTSGQTGSAGNIPAKNIEAKSISGDITITFL